MSLEKKWQCRNPVYCPRVICDLPEWEMKQARSISLHLTVSECGDHQKCLVDRHGKWLCLDLKTRVMSAVEAEVSVVAPLGCQSAALVGKWFGLMPDMAFHLHALLVLGCCWRLPVVLKDQWITTVVAASYMDTEISSCIPIESIDHTECSIYKIS